MGQALFYHLINGRPEETARMLIARALDRGWRVMVRGGDRARLDRLDDLLWTGNDEDFLPHGREGGAADARQPVLIGQGAAVNGAVALILLDGAEAGLDEARAMDRVWHLFEANDRVQMTAARGQWTRLTGAGIGAQYWSDESGRWVMKTERPAQG